MNLKNVVAEIINIYETIMLLASKEHQMNNIQLANNQNDF